ncbi:MAG: hypothetical protein JXA04_01305 [Gammaproteobacteria bacterium]|nr:hypothetical protein [Gammaproteobacteria bacterium]
MSVTKSTIGIIYDLHNTNEDNATFQFISSGPRFYSNALTNLQNFINAVEVAGVDAIIQGGDQVSNEKDGGGKTKGDLVDEVQAILHSTDIPAYNVMGNWELPTGFTDTSDYFSHMKNGSASYDSNAVEYANSDSAEIRRYYKFDFGDAVGIVLDATGVDPSQYPDDEYYKGDADVGQWVLTASYIRATQLAWLAATLAAETEKPILIFCHYWFYKPDMEDSFGFGWQIRNSSEVLAIIEAHQASHGNIAGLVSGHHHPGGSAWWDNVNCNPVTDPTNAVYHAAQAPFMTLRNGVKHFRLASSVRGWGSESEAPDETAANCYYIFEVGEFVTGKPDCRVYGYGNNPGGDSQESNGYLIF